MEFLQNLSRKQSIGIVAGVSLIVIFVLTFFVYLNTENKQVEEEKQADEMTVQEKRDELEELRNQSSEFEPTEDPKEQKSQLEILRKQNQLEEELGEKEEVPGETSDPEIQKQELDELRKQAQ